jgi:hypothetical protein
MGAIESAPWERGPAFGDPVEPADRYPPGSDQPAPWSQAPGSFDRQPAAAASDTVQRGELQPVMAADGSGLPQDMWQGLGASELQEMIAPVDIGGRGGA